MKFNKTSANKTIQELVKILEDYGKSHGLNIERGSASYDDNNVSFKITARIDSPEVENKRIERFIMEADLYFKLKLKKKDFEVPFTYQGEQYVVHSVNTRKYKAPIIIKKVNNKDKKFGAPVELFKKIRV